MGSRSVRVVNSERFPVALSSNPRWGQSGGASAFPLGEALLISRAGRDAQYSPPAVALTGCPSPRPNLAGGAGGCASASCTHGRTAARLRAASVREGELACQVGYPSAATHRELGRLVSRASRLRMTWAPSHQSVRESASTCMPNPRMLAPRAVAGARRAGALSVSLSPWCRGRRPPSSAVRGGLDDVQATGDSGGECQRGTSKRIPSCPAPKARATDRGAPHGWFFQERLEAIMKKCGVQTARDAAIF